MRLGKTGAKKGSARRGKGLNMTYNILVSDRKLVVRRLEELAGKRAEYTRVPRMAYIVEGIAVERDGTVTTEEGAGIEMVRTLIAEGLIQGEEHEATVETTEAAEVEAEEVTDTTEDDEPTEATTEPAETEEPAERDEPTEATTEPAETEEPAERDELTEATTETGETEEPAEREELTEDEDATEEENSDTEEASETESVQAMEIEGPEEEAPTATCYEDLIEHEPEPPEAIKPSISFPLAAHRAESIVNLVCSIYSRGNLLSKATGGVFSASEELVDSLQMVSGRAGKEEVLRIIRDEGGINGVSFTEDKVVFDGFPETTDADAIRAWTVLSAAINKNAIKQIHVRAKEVDETNEKFAFRTWLTRLGMNGKDLRAERNILYRNLSGHTAFRTDKDEEKWKKRQAAKRAELKALKAAANAESDEGAAED